MTGNNVLSRGSTPTTARYRSAVSTIMRNIQGEMTDHDLAERLGCHENTIRNARNKKGDLSPITLARIGHEFGVESVNPFVALFSAIAVYAHGSAANDMHTIAGLAHVTGDWVERLRDGRRCHNDTIALATALRPLLSALQTVVEEADRHQEASAA